MWIDPAMPAMIQTPTLRYLTGRGFPPSQAAAILKVWDRLTPSDLQSLGFGPRPTIPPALSIAKRLATVRARKRFRQ